VNPITLAGLILDRVWVKDRKSQPSARLLPNPGSRARPPNPGKSMTFTDDSARLL
jgi:hypothetical protein